MSLPITPGRCRTCACTEAEPCWSCRHVHDGCSWYDRSRTVCSNPDCVGEYERKRAATIAASKPRKLASYEIEELRRKERNERKRRSRKGRAA